MRPVKPQWSTTILSAERRQYLLRHPLELTFLVVSGDPEQVLFAALAKREGVSPSYFTRLVRLSYLAPDITEAILDGRQPRDLTADKLLAHSRLPLGWREQKAVLGFA